MRDGRELERKIEKAQNNNQIAEQMIEQYIPYIRSETAKFLKTFPVEDSDEFSIAMFAFYECIMAYTPGKGSFFGFASRVIRNRLIDYTRKQKRHSGQISLDSPVADEDGRTVLDSLETKDCGMENLSERMTVQKEIGMFSGQLEIFGLNLSDVAKECPKQKRTMEECMEVLRYARSHPEFLTQLLQTKKLPLSFLVKGAGVRRKTIERHRKYVVAILLAYTNGYEMIREHLKGIGKTDGKEETEE